ncbi:molecular chaperone TorD family protein [bacterium]|nr:molecular chaperone TorD family protein [bacterium]
MDSNAMMSDNKKRESCYRFLAAWFYEPQKDLFAEVNLFENLVNYLKDICPDAAVFADEMAAGIQAFTDEELNVEYARLFMGPFNLIAPPYGSVHMEEGARVMGESTMEVIDVYQKEGLARSDNFKDLPDHIVVELEFMSYLLFKEREALQKSDSETAGKYRDKQENFLENYLQPWIRPFCGKISAGTENAFYSALAKCVSAYVLSSCACSQRSTQQV